MSGLIQGFVLAGGKSSRMGVPKANLAIGGVTLLDRAADALRSISSGGVIVIWPASDKKLRSIPDVEIEGKGRPGGALVGLYTALLAAETDWIAVLACDMPFVTGDLLTGLASIDRAGVDAVVPFDSAGLPQPLCALYRPPGCIAAIERCFAGGDRSLRGLLVSIKTRSIGLAALGPALSPHSFLNVNTPADLDNAIRLSGSII